MISLARRLAALLAFAAIGFAAAPVPVTAASSHVVNIVASNWKFTPSTITLDVGQPTTLRLTSKEGVHGLHSSDLGIPMTALHPGSYSTVVVTPTKVGTYVLHCAIFCGLGHADMKLTVVVKQ